MFRERHGSSVGEYLAASILAASSTAAGALTNSAVNSPLATGLIITLSGVVAHVVTRHFRTRFSGPKKFICLYTFPHCARNPEREFAGDYVVGSMIVEYRDDEKFAASGDSYEQSTKGAEPVFRLRWRSEDFRPGYFKSAVPFIVTSERPQYRDGLMEFELHPNRGSLLFKSAGLAVDCSRVRIGVGQVTLGKEDSAPRYPTYAEALPVRANTRMTEVNAAIRTIEFFDCVRNFANNTLFTDS